MNKGQKCTFCEELKGGVFVSSPPREKPRALICEECVAICAMIVLAKQQEKRNTREAAK